MAHTEFNWTGNDGQNIYAQYWQPEDGAPKAVVCLVHGMNEHSGRYAHVADYFNKKNYALIAYDQRGHGKSDGSRGHAKDLDYLLNEIDNLLKKATELFPNTPQFIYGHSMGGGLVVNYCLTRKPSVKAAIVTSPWLELKFEPPSYKVNLGKLMRRIYPGFTENSGINANDLSHDKVEVNKYVDDPLVHNRVSTSYFFGIRDAGKWSIENANQLEIPMLVAHAGEDKITSCDASERFAKNAGKLAQFKKWDGMYHEIHNEVQKIEVLSYTWKWMDDQL